MKIKIWNGRLHWAVPPRREPPLVAVIRRLEQARARVTCVLKAPPKLKPRPVPPRPAVVRVRASCSSSPRPRESGARVVAAGRDGENGRDDGGGSDDDGGGGGSSGGSDPPPAQCDGDARGVSWQRQGRRQARQADYRKPDHQEGRCGAWLDTASRPGMSGSPVILRSYGTHLTEGHKFTLSGGAANKFIGIYSGRLHTTDPLDAQIGMVWPATYIDEIIDGGLADHG